MQKKKGLYALLKNPLIYEIFQFVVGSQKSRQWMADAFWHVAPGDKILDLGCGPGSQSEFFSQECTYIGIDINHEYIQSAQKKYPARVFQCMDVTTLNESNNNLYENSELIIIKALLHHLSDYQVDKVLSFAKKNLAHNGRIFIYEPTYLIHQGFLSRWIMSKDRGACIRTEKEWKTLVHKQFDRVETHIITHLHRIPYVYIFITCRR